MIDDHTLSDKDPRVRRPDGTYNIYLVDYFAVLIEQFGPPSHAVVPDADTIERYRGRLPDDLLKFWSRYGWGSWARAKYWLCDPETVRPVLEAVFARDREFDPATMTGYGYNAFGEIKVWLGDGASMRLDLPRAYVSTQERAFMHQFNRWDTDHRAIAGTLMTNIHNPEVMPDDDGEDLFPRAVEALGELRPGEIYGFFPALALGGPRSLANLKRVPVAEHLVLLNSLQPPVLHRYTPPANPAQGFGDVVPVRPIGP